MNAQHADGAQRPGSSIRRADAAACLSGRGSVLRSALTVNHVQRDVLPTRAPSLRSQLDRDLESWFVSAILPHEAALTGFLKRVCKSLTEVPDLRQETYIRVCKRAKQSRPRFPKAFLFATARNLVIDRVRRERVVREEHVPDGIPLELS